MTDRETVRRLQYDGLEDTAAGKMASFVVDQADEWKRFWKGLIISIPLSLLCWLFIVLAWFAVRNA